NGLVALGAATAALARRPAGWQRVIAGTVGPKAAVGGEEGLRVIEAAADNLATTAFERGGAGAVMDHFAEAVAGGEVVLAGEKLLGESQGVGIGIVAATAQADGDGLALAMLLEEIDSRGDEAAEGVAGVDEAEELDGEFALLLPAQVLRGWTSVKWLSQCVSRCSRNITAV